MDKVDLPESLRDQLHLFEGRLRWMESAVAVLGALIGVLLSYLLLFFSDRFWDTHWLLRAALFAGGILCCSWFARLWLRHWYFRRRNVRDLARLIQRRFPQLGDRLLGIVELAENGSDPEVGSPALVAAAIRQVSAETEKYDFKAAVETNQPRRFTLVFIGAALLSAVLLGLFPAAGVNTWKRWFKPLSPIDRYTFVSLDALPHELIVPHGEPFPLRVGLRGESRWRPPQARARCGRQSPISARLNRGLAEFEIPGQTAPIDLVVTVGDARRSVQLLPTPRPVLTNLQVTVVYPEYLARPSITKDVANSGLELLRGSRLHWRGEVDRSLAGAWLHGQGRTVPLTTEKSSFRGGDMLLEQGAALAFSWRDTHGLSAAKPRRVALRTREDAAPLVECPELARYTAILIDESIEIKVRASDDLGLRFLRLAWQVEAAGQADAAPGKIERRSLASGGPTTEQLTGAFIFSPSLMGIPEQSVVTLFAEAADYHPERPPSRSEEHRIYVLSRAEHAKLLMRQMEQLQARLEELARREEDLLAGKENIKDQANAELDSKKTDAALEEQSLEESASSAEMERLAQEAAEILKELMRNSEFPQEMLKEWAEMSRDLQAMASKDMQEMIKSLQQAAQKSGNKRREDVAKAAKQQLEILRKLRDMLDKFDRAIEAMMARNFVTRLREVAAAEMGINGRYKSILAKTIGARPIDLAAALRRKLGDMRERNTRARLETKNIMSDLAGFFARTRFKKYDAVHKAMKKAEVLDGLSALTETISKNQGVKAIRDAKNWADKFVAWAEMLEKKNSERDGKSDGDSEMTDQQLALLLKLMRIVQAEEEVRSRTRHLENNRDDDLRYTEKSHKLQDRQLGLRDLLGEVMAEVTHPGATMLLKRVERAMLDAAGLLRVPRTDSPTIAAETEVIELLTASGGCEGKGGCSGAGCMPSLQGMGLGMGNGAGAGGGGSNAGGTTDEQNAFVGGNATGKRSPDRSSERFAGKNLDNVPAEFRDLLQAYYNGLEAIGR